MVAAGAGEGEPGEGPGPGGGGLSAVFGGLRHRRPAAVAGGGSEATRVCLHEDRMMIKSRCASFESWHLSRRASSCADC